MANNVVITPGTGNTIGADEVTDADLGSIKVQYVKLMDGTLDGTDKALVDASGLKVNLGADNDITGTVTANLSATDNAVLDTIVSTQTDGTQKTKIVGGTGDVADVLTSNGGHGLATVIPGHISTDNSTATPLSANATYTGTWEDVTNHGIIISTVITSHASATDGFVFQTSSDGTNIDNTDEYTVAAGVGKTFSFQAANKYFRIVYTNGSTLQTYFRLQTILKPTYAKPSSHRISDSLSLQDDSELVKAVIAGETTAGGGSFVNVKVNPSGTLETNATQSGTWNITNVSGTVSLPTGASTSAKQDTIIGHVDGIEGLLTTIDSDTGTIATEVAGLLTDTELRATPVPVSGTVTANLGATDNAVLDDIASDTEAIKTSLAGTLTVTGGGGGVEYTEDAAAAADPVGGALIMVRDDALSGQTTTDGDNVAARGTDKGELYVKHVDAIPVTDNGGVLTVDGTVAVTNAGITTIAGAVSGTEMQVDVLTMPTTAVTNAGITTIAGAVSGTEMQVDVLTMPTVAVTQSGTWDEVGINDSGNSITVDYATTGSGTATGALRVELPTNGTGVVGLNAGTNNIGDVDIASIAAGDNNIGNVDIVTVPTDPFGATADAAVTAGATGSISAKLRSISRDIVSNIVLAAGTNAIGKLSANSGVDIGDVTLTAGTAAIGTVLPPDQDITTHTNYAKKYYTNAGAVTDGIIWSPAAGKRWHVVSIIINTSAATTVTLEDDKAGGDEVVMKLDLAANSGIAYNFTEHYPLASGEDAADLLVTTSAGNIFITAVGYEL